MSGELTPPTRLVRGSRGSEVAVVQEWLTIHGIRVAIDGEFGPATERAIRTFQGLRLLERTGDITAETWDALVAPLALALRPPRVDTDTLGRVVVEVARQHLFAQPREVGGPNRGPWVRHYCKGRQDKWCAGFALTMLEQACAHLERPMPVPFTLSCDVLATRAMQKGRLVTELVARTAEVRPGMLFLLRSKTNPTDWIHAGLVEKAEDEAVQTIEGNSNVAGSTDGDGVYRRVRPRARLDFVRVE